MADKLIHTRFLPGDDVRIGDIHGHVTCVSVTWTNICRYEVSYWDSGKKYEVWCFDFELSEV